MKLLLMLAAVALLLWLLRGRSKGVAGGRPAADASEPAAMVRCAHCGVHLPASDALAGPGAQPAWYCCVDHRNSAG